ncbi:MAG: DUF1127 domain-containing protein [Hyphomicrobiaceae bacterium]|nr:DUF1127 domain-containing protein [Hyphomicrobiaceae bacterium]
MSAQTIEGRGPVPHQTRYVRTALRHLGAFICYLVACLDVARQRRQLQRLDERALKDIGISAHDVKQEADRSFWDIPEGLRHR